MPPLRFAFCISQLIIVYMFRIYFSFVLTLTMCLNNCLASKDNAINDMRLQSSDLSDTCEYIDYDDSWPTRNSDLLVLQLNIRGVQGKMNELQYLIDNNPCKRVPDVILLCETWQTPCSPSINIPGYKTFAHARSHKKGGGVAILIGSNIPCRLRDDLTSKQASTNRTKPYTEFCFVEIKTPRKTIIIGSMYRPPNVDTREFLKDYEELLNKIKGEKKELILGTDHNLDLLKSHCHGVTSTFLDMNLDRGIFPTITRPTRLTHTSATLIDNILVTENLLDRHEARILIDNISDHLTCLLSIQNLLVRNNTEIEVEYRDMSKLGCDRLKEELGRINWETISAENSLDENMSKFSKILETNCDHFLPLKQSKIKASQLRKEAWVTSGLLKSIKREKTLYRQSVSAKATEKSKRKYKEYNFILRKVKRHAKKSHYIENCVKFKDNTKQLWKVINRIVNKQSDKTTVIPHLDIDKIKVTQAQEIANELGKYFSQVGKNYAEKVGQSKKGIDEYLSKIRMYQDSIFLSPTNPDEIKKLIEKLPHKTSSGYDRINNIILKELKDIICVPLSQLFNRSLNEGKFPTCMKLAEVVPLHKGGKMSAPNNYRPISLLLTVSKLLEKVMYKRVYNFLTDTNQLYSSQYGFRSQHSCDHAINELLCTIIKNLERQCTTISIFLDLSKAFDTLEHPTIYKKLERYGIRGQALDWFKDYLNNRNLRVKCRTGENGILTTSDTYPVEYGAPQGSCLGPLIFLIFCNDLHYHLDYLNCIQFADDTTLYLSHHSKKYLRFMLETDLENISDWFRANKLTLNVGKTNCLVFGDNQPELTSALSINGERMHVTRTTKFLGVWIDDRLNWNRHIEHMKNRLKSRVCMIRKGINMLTTHAKKILYHAQIESVITYGLGTWGYLLNKNQQKTLQTIQNQAIRVIEPKLHTADIYKKHKILNVKQLTQLENFKIWKKLDMNNLPCNLSRALTMDHMRKDLSKRHGYSTRNKSLPNLPKAHTKLYRNSILFQGLRDYQLLPASVRNEKMFRNFVTKTKNFLLHPAH